MKKFILTLLFLLSTCAFAADKLHVEAMDDFSTLNPSETFSVKLVDDAKMNDIFMIKGDIINCVLKKITDPTRAKRDAKIFLIVESYEDNKGIHKLNEPLLAKYAKTVLNKEEIKKTPPKKIVKSAAGFVGGLFVKGFSYCVSFVDGFSQNKEDNRLKSGAKQVYKDSILSYVEYGHEVEIKKGDIFYLVVKSVKEDEKNEKQQIEESKGTEEILSDETTEDTIKPDKTQEQNTLIETDSGEQINKNIILPGEDSTKNQEISE